MAVPPAPVRVPSQRSLAPSVASVANDKGDNEMILGADEEAVRSVIASNGVPLLQMRSVGSHSTSKREKEGNKEWTGLGQSTTAHGSMAVVYENLRERSEITGICVTILRQKAEL